MGDERAAAGSERTARRGLLGTSIDRVAGAVVPVVTRQVDADELLSRVDVESLLGRIDLDAVLARVDVDALIARIDIDALVQRVDVDAIVQRVDVDALIKRVDVDGIVQRVDIDGLMERTEVGDIISRSTGQVASKTLDLVRRQLVGLDAIAIGFVDRVLRRDPAARPTGPASLVPPGGGA